MSRVAEPEWWEWLADTAADLLADRQRGYPALVAAGHMTQAEADDGIRVMASIAADWRRITALYAGQPAEPEDLTASRAEKRLALTGAIERLRVGFNRLFLALPRQLPRPIGSTAREVDREGSTMEDLIRAANNGEIAPDILRPAARAWDRLKAAELMLCCEQRELRPAFWAEVTVELRARARASRQDAA